MSWIPGGRRRQPFVIDEAEYQIVKYIMDQYDLEHLDPTRSPANAMILDTAPDAETGWNAAPSSVLRNPFYAGTVIWNGISFDGTHETRLDPARYQERIKRMDARRRSPKTPQPINCPPLGSSGLLKSSNLPALTDDW